MSWEGEVQRVHLLKTLANPYSRASIGGRARARRWAEFVNRFPDVREMRVLDLGGDPRDWRAAPLRPLQLTVLNVDIRDTDEDWIVMVRGDACAAASALAGERFDVVYSNSVLEHVGGHWRRLAFADACYELADRHWIQTPYRYFPIEPHWLAPGAQFLPTRALANFTRRWPFAHFRRAATPEEAVDRALATELLSRTAMRFYFPASEIWRERMFGLTKSLVALRA